MKQKLNQRGHTSHIALHTSQKGITLIALVITIIVLLILAGVTINMVLGDNGIIGQAQGAKEAQKFAMVSDRVATLAGEIEACKYSNSFPSITYFGEFTEQLVKDKIIDEDDVNKMTYNSTSGIIKLNEREITTKVFFCLPKDGNLDQSTITKNKYSIDDNGKFDWNSDARNQDEYGNNAWNAEFKLSGTAILPQRITEIKESAFYGCPSDESYTVVCQDGLKKIGNMAFIATNLKTIVLPDTLEEIGDSAFGFGCQIESIVIPEGTKTIGTAAFLYAENLKNVTIPSTIEKIGAGAFNGVGAEVIYNGSSTQLKNLGVYIPAGQEYFANDYPGWGFTSAAVIKCTDGNFRYSYENNAVTLTKI